MIGPGVYDAFIMFYCLFMVFCGVFMVCLWNGYNVFLIYSSYVYGIVHVSCGFIVFL